MKKFTNMLCLVFILFSFSCSDDSSSPSEEVIADPVNQYSFDVKTKLSEKLDVTGAKNGLISYLQENEWSDVTETGEDYSVWIKNCVRDDQGTKVIVTFDLELRTAAMITEGELVKSTSLTCSYDKNADWDDGVGGIDYAALAKDLVAIVEIAKYIPGAGTIKVYVDKILGLIEPLMTEGEGINHKAEGVIVGSQAYIQLKKWILEIEK